MTVQVIIGGTEWYEFATTRGMGDFARWVDGLPKDDFPLLSHLSDWGWVYDLDKLQAEISKAEILIEPSDPLHSSIASLKNAIAKAGRKTTIMLTDGLGPDNDEPDEWWIDGKLVTAKDDDN